MEHATSTSRPIVTTSQAPILPYPVACVHRVAPPDPTLGNTAAIAKIV